LIACRMLPQSLTGIEAYLFVLVATLPSTPEQSYGARLTPLRPQMCVHANGSGRKHPSPANPHQNRPSSSISQYR